MISWKGLCLTTAILLAGVAGAETGMDMNSTSSRGNIWADSNEVSRGFRIALRKAAGSATGKIKATKGLVEFEGPTSQDFDHEYGFSLGYGVIKAGQAGFIGELSLDQMQDDLRFIRLEGGISYGFTYEAYGYLGLNINSISVDNESTVFDAAAGLQLGAGYQINPNIAIDAKYLITRNTAKSDLGTAEVELSFSMIQLGIVATF
ncbi:MAG: hypothetical protein KDD61_13570 [Bdellovibrionales bacterium]|nr:hypothetical protein [Bdellovibrionales bacterium]